MCKNVKKQHSLSCIATEHVLKFEMWLQEMFAQKHLFFLHESVCPPPSLHFMHSLLAVYHYIENGRNTNSC
jgi:hypothetical protein